MRPLLPLLFSLFAGCIVSPQPEPPLAPVFDLTKIAMATLPAPGLRQEGLVGVPGAAPADVELIATNLSQPQQLPGRTTVAADGSFTVAVNFAPTLDVVRLDTLRGDAIDVLVGLDRGVSLYAAPLRSCLVIDSAYLFIGARVGAVSSGSVLIQNGCSDAVDLSSISLRESERTDVSLVGQDAWDRSLASGESRALRFAWTPSAEGALHTHVLISITGQTGLRAITLRGFAEP